jgi:hypothetical protein
LGIATRVIAFVGGARVVALARPDFPFVDHALHRARWTVNFAFQASVVDRLLGTEADDWEARYAHVSSEKPMTA